MADPLVGRKSKPTKADLTPVQRMIRKDSVAHKKKFTSTLAAVSWHRVASPFNQWNGLEEQPLSHSIRLFIPTSLPLYLYTSISLYLYTFYTSILLYLSTSLTTSPQVRKRPPLAKKVADDSDDGWGDSDEEDEHIPAAPKQAKALTVDLGEQSSLRDTVVGAKSTPVVTKPEKNERGGRVKVGTGAQAAASSAGDTRMLREIEQLKKQLKIEKLNSRDLKKQVEKDRSKLRIAQDKVDLLKESSAELKQEARDAAARAEEVGMTEHLQVHRLDLRTDDEIAIFPGTSRSGGYLGKSN